MKRGMSGDYQQSAIPVCRVNRIKIPPWHLPTAIVAGVLVIGDGEKRWLGLFEQFRASR